MELKKKFLVNQATFLTKTDIMKTGCSCIKLKLMKKGTK